MSTKLQMDLMGYFGIPSDDRPQPSSSRARGNKKVKKRISACLLQQKCNLKADCERGQTGAAVTDSNKLTAENQQSETSYGTDKDDHTAKRARVSLDTKEDIAIDLTEDKLEEFSDHESSHGANEQPNLFTSTELKQQRLDQYWKQRRKNSRSAFSIHSSIYGRPRQLSAQMHNTRLLHGKGTTNILSQLFQRSVQPYSIKTRNMTSYIQSGQHWNISKTVQLGTRRIDGEVSAMSFDNEGVLLATGDDGGFVRIYDFDDVNALDVRKRNELGRCLNLHESGVDEVPSTYESHESDCTDQIQVVSVDNNLDDVPEVEPALSKPILSFRCTSYRITDLQWNPNNQDQLAVSFAQSAEIHLYNVASPKTPMPRVTIGASNTSSTKGREGISVMRFLSVNLPKKKPTQILTGGSRGTVRLWLVPGMKKGQSMKDVSARCIWSVDISESNGEGCSDMLVLPSANNALADKPLVLLSGQAGSLVLLNTGKCTRKSFSTTVTPTIQSTWDLYNLTARELTKQDDNIKLPARRWMGVNKMSLLGCNCTDGISSYRISLVLNCGWVLTVNLTVTTQMVSSTIPNSGENHNFSASLRVQIAHQTPRVQCYNSSGERVTTLGGMALNCSLPDIPIPSSMPINSLKQMVWIGDVKPKKYTMPSKDKFVLCEQHGTITSNAPSSNDIRLRQQGDGLVLLDITSDTRVTCLKRRSQDDPLEHNDSHSKNEHSNVLARLPFGNGTPLSLAVHPAGEWMVIGYGSNGRGAMKRLELACMRKAL
jgi:hypothetical protein